VQRSIVDVRAQAVPPVFLVIRDKMFGARLDADTLNASDSLIGGFTVEVRIGAETCIGQ
jgi:hypothetical protein